VLRSGSDMNNIYCNMFYLLKTLFRLLIGLFNSVPIVTTINCDTVTGLHTLQTVLTNLFTLFSSVHLFTVQRGSYTSLTELHTPNLTVLQHTQSLEVTVSLNWLTSQLSHTITDYHTFGSSSRDCFYVSTVFCLASQSTLSHTPLSRPLILFPVAT
jgi:hypothetical protein